MSAGKNLKSPRLELCEEKILFNIRFLVSRLASLGISVCGVTKGLDGDLRFARMLAKNGCVSLGDNNLDHLGCFRQAFAGVGRLYLSLSSIGNLESVHEVATCSLQSDVRVLKELNRIACLKNQVHNVILMVETGDLREGILRKYLSSYLQLFSSWKFLCLKGFATNLGCLSGVLPNQKNMQSFAGLKAEFADFLPANSEDFLLSFGSSSALEWLFSNRDIPLVLNHIRIGEAFLLGHCPGQCSCIEGMKTNTIELVCRVVEVKRKPMQPFGGIIGLNAFGERSKTIYSEKNGWRILVNCGRADVDPEGIELPPDLELIGASSDYLVLYQRRYLYKTGDEIRFRVQYKSLLGAAMSKRIAKIWI